MSKIIFLDADGVMVKLRQQFSSNRLNQDYGIPLDNILPFYKNEFQKCILGQMDIKEALIPYIKLWDWNGTVDELLHYLWKEEKQVNQEVIDWVDNMRKLGHKFFLATDQEKYKASFLMNDMELKDHLDGAFFSYAVGISKGKREYWDKVLGEVGVENPNEVFYFDDEMENIEAAQSAGVQAYFYKDINDFKVIK